MTLVLSNSQISGILTMQDCIEILEEALIELAEGRGANRRRSDICTPTDYADGGIYVLKSMDGVIPKLGIGAIRINSDIVTFPCINGSVRKVKVPAAPNQRYIGLVLLFSTTTGEPLAIFPDGLVQPMRVGATSALGAKCLARQHVDTVALLGTGSQARSQARAIVCVRDVRQIHCYSPNPKHREAFAEEMSTVIATEIKPVDSAEQAVAGADIVLCATNSSAPVLKRDWIKRGVHLSAIQPSEISSEVVKEADVVATLMQDCDPLYITTHGLRAPDEPGAGQQNLAQEVGWSDLTTLPQLLLDRKGGRNSALGRASDDQVTCFLNPMGVGCQFAAIGALIYQRAKEKGCGHHLSTDWFTETEVP